MGFNKPDLELIKLILNRINEIETEMAFDSKCFKFLIYFISNIFWSKACGGSNPAWGCLYRLSYELYISMSKILTNEINEEIQIIDGDQKVTTHNG